MIGAWVVVAGLTTADTLATRDYVSLLDDSGTLPVNSLPLQRIAPADFADALTWVRLALAADESGTWRVRWTDIDNSPSGRPVYWNSGFVHLVAIAGKLRRLMTAEPIPTATEQSLAWFNLPLFVLIVVLFSTWVTSRLGVAGGILIAFGMVGYEWFYLGFAPNYVDHHGLLVASTTGLMLGATFMGAGWRNNSHENTDSYLLLNISQPQARRAAIASALCGAFGLWISAASIIPTIAIIGLAGVVTAWIFGPRAKMRHTVFDASVWRMWGRVGCIGALIAYVAEFAPHHFSMRLEVNHPLYALAWLGGAEFVALVGEWRASDAAPPAVWRMALAAIAAACPLSVIALAGSRVFIPADSALAQMHRGIGEFQSLRAYIRVSGVSSVWRFASGFVLLLPALLVARVKQHDRVLVFFAASVSLASVGLACWQVRWWLTASGVQLSLLLVAAVSTFNWKQSRVQWLVALPLSAIFGAQALSRIHTTRSNVEARSVTQADALQPLYRDAAIALRSSNPGAPITLLSTPTASMAIGYFGRFNTISSLYWENVDGLRTAATILWSSSDAAAHRIVRERGITHIAAIAADDFLPNLFALASPNSRARTLDETFDSRLLDLRKSPHWLRPIPFSPRFPDRTDHRAYLYEVVPEQTDLDAAWNIALAELAVGNIDDGGAEFERAIESANTTRRPELYENAGRIAYQSRAHRLAVRLLNSAMALRPSHAIATNIAWIQATSADEAVRDGRVSLLAAERLTAEDPSDMMALDVLGAALAENARFGEAVAAAQRMAMIARAHADTATEQRAFKRIRAYLAGRPWRQ